MTRDQVENVSTQELRRMLDAANDREVPDLVRHELALCSQFAEGSSITVASRKQGYREQVRPNLPTPHHMSFRRTAISMIGARGKSQKIHFEATRVCTEQR